MRVPVDIDEEPWLTSQNERNSRENMNCMEVCGGHGEGVSYYRRPGLDVWVLSRVKQNVTSGGGDLHLLSSCASGRITRMLLADICGFGPLFHGVATRLRKVMKRNVNTIKQARSEREMSEQLAEAAQYGGFASTLMTTYFAPTRSFSVCNAGHPPPLLYRSRVCEWSQMKPSEKSTTTTDGYSELLAAGEFQHMKTSLELGDMVLACSNSLTETRSSSGQTMGLDSLLTRVQQLDCDTPHEMPRRLVDEIVSEHSDNLSDSDCTIVLCQATKTKVGWRDNVLAPFRLLRSVSDTTSIA